MAGNLINTLYPPLVDTFMPAFIYNSEYANIVFSLSPYNTPETIKKIHVSIVDQKTNQYVLQDTNLSSESTNNGVVIQGIYICDFANVLFPNDATGLYTVQIPKSLLKLDTTDTVNGQDTESANWKTELWYQAQIRLDSCGDPIVSGETPLGSDYILKNRQYFSEWSNVTLLRAIPRPVFFFSGIDEDSSKVILSTGIIDSRSRYTYQQDIIPSYNKGFVPISAMVLWQNSPEVNTEYLDRYQITVYKDADSSFILDSGTLYIGNGEKDSVYYLADMNNVSTGLYIVHIEAETRNGYKWWDEKTIDIASFIDDDAHKFETIWDFNRIKLNSYGQISEKIVTEEDGFVKGKVKTKQSMLPGWLYIYRSSSADNYQHNDIIQVTYQNGEVEQEFEDKTVSSLLQYRYKAQYHFQDGPWSPARWAQYGLAEFDYVYVYPEFYDMLFLRQDKQLAIRFDATISSLKPTVNRVKIDTLGGKYPRFAENARMNYKQFSISGLISAEEDFNRKFLDENSEEFAPSLEAYDEHIGNDYQVRNDTLIGSFDNPLTSGKHDTYLHDNWYWEREFREKAMAWLNDGEPKLFRSMTEGNMIVMLNDISLTPNKTLGRRLYNFSATMYEIGDGNDLNLINKYGIVTIRNDEVNPNNAANAEIDKNKNIVVERLQQYILSGDRYITNTDLITGTALDLDDLVGGQVDPITIWDKLSQEYTGINKQRAPKIGTAQIKNLKIQFTSEPMWMNSDLEFVENLNEVTSEPPLFGYKFKLKTANDSAEHTIFVNSKGYYQVPSDLIVTGLKFFDNETYELNYILSYQIKSGVTYTVSKIERVKDLVGQYTGAFTPNEPLGDTIRSKYRRVVYNPNANIASITSEQEMQQWTGISFDVTPYALLNIKETKDGEWQERLVGQTGVYNLMPNYNMYDVKFMGRRMILADTDNRPYLDEWQYVLDFGDSSENPSDSYYWYNILVRSGSNDVNIQQTDVLVKINSFDIRDYANINWINLGMGSSQSITAYYQINGITNPQYNTIYKVANDPLNPSKFIYVIYYLDNAFYEVEFPNENQGDYSICIAKVPIYGAINYRGTIVKRHFSTS